MRMHHLTAVLGLWVVAGCGDSSRSDGTEGAPATPAPAGAGGEATAGTPAGSGGTAIEIVAVVAGRKLESRGNGECQHAAEGSIYQRPASLWTARFDGGDAGPIRHVNLTFWRERAGTESFNLAIGTDGNEYRIATVEGGQLHGRGRATLEGSAEAGTLVVEGTAEDGTAIQLRARCERFTPLVAEGG
jgi:hypothetical protein